MSSASINPSPARDDEEPQRRLTRVPLWVPISAFIGTTLALGIPLLVLRRQRSVLRMSLKEGGQSAPPPRRVVALENGGKSSTSLSPFPPLTRAPAASTGTSTDAALPDNIFSTSESEMETASMASGLSRMTKSSAVLAAKAFMIATGLVAVGTAGFVWTVRETLGVRDVREFGSQMRILLSTKLPSLSDAIYRPPQPLTEEERQEMIVQKLDRASIAEVNASSKWKWEDAEQRLQRAYEEGGVPLWAQVALRELEAESHIEREKREKELKDFKSQRTS